MSTMLENASEVLFVLGILFTVAGVIFREIRRAKDSESLSGFNFPFQAQKGVLRYSLVGDSKSSF